MISIFEHTSEKTEEDGEVFACRFEDGRLHIAIVGSYQATSIEQELHSGEDEEGKFEYSVLNLTLEDWGDNARDYDV